MSNFRRIFWFPLVCILVSGIFSEEYTDDRKNIHERIYKMKAVFIYNFTKFIEWPDNRNNGPFVIAVLGDSRITPFLSFIASKKKVNGRTITIHEIDHSDMKTEAHLLFIDSTAADTIKMIPHSTGSSLLVVTDKGKAAESIAGISFYIENDKLKFEINRKNIKNADLFVSSRLLKLAHLTE